MPHKRRPPSFHRSVLVDSFRVSIHQRYGAEGLGQLAIYRRAHGMQNAVAVSVRLRGIWRLRRIWLVGEGDMQVGR